MRCPDAALLEYTQHTFPLLLSLPWVNKSEETEKLWLLSRGNASTYAHCSNKVAWRKAWWLTGFSTQRGEGFHLFHHSQFMLPKHVMDHLSLNLYSTGGHKATLWSWCFVTLWHFTISQSGVFCRWSSLQTAKSICQLDRRCAGSSWPPVGRKAKQTWVRNEHRTNIK